MPGPLIAPDTCDKYYRFLQVLDAYNIPLVTLVDTPPLLPDESLEASGALRHFGKILDVYATATIPKISVVIREAYADAGALILGAGRGLGTDLCYAWPIATYAIEASALDPAEAYGKGVDADAVSGYLGRAREKIDVFEAARSWTAQAVDEVIEPAATRQKIIEALELTRNKRESLPGRAKTHGTAPC